MAEAWEMRTNVRKPGGQGTLFQVADKNALLNPQQRWPKGYTPERQREVKEATHVMPIVYPQRLEDEHEPGEYHEMDSYKPKVQQVIARSTVPVEHLKGLKEIHGEPQKGDDGTYWFNKRTIGIDMTRHDADKVLIHELGHHYDSMHDVARPLAGDIARVHAERDVPQWRKDLGGPDAVNTTDVSMALSKVDPGVREAVADNYAMEHYRSPGKIANQKMMKRGLYENNFTPRELDQEYPGYTDVRPAQPQPGARNYPHGHLGPQFDNTSQGHLEGMDRHWVQQQKDIEWDKKMRGKQGPNVFHATFTVHND